MDGNCPQEKRGGCSALSGPASSLFIHRTFSLSLKGGTRDVAHTEECLPSVYAAPDLIPSTRGVRTRAGNLQSQHSTEASEVRGHSWPHSEFKANLDHVRPCLRAKVSKMGHRKENNGWRGCHCTEKRGLREEEPILPPGHCGINYRVLFEDTGARLPLSSRGT